MIGTLTCLSSNKYNSIFAKYLHLYTLCPAERSLVSSCSYTRHQCCYMVPHTPKRSRLGRMRMDHILSCIRLYLWRKWIISFKVCYLKIEYNMKLYMCGPCTCIVKHVVWDAIPIANYFRICADEKWHIKSWPTGQIRDLSPKLEKYLNHSFPVNVNTNICIFRSINIKSLRFCDIMIWNISLQHR